MRSDEWTSAMENEAASVEDVEWAAETRRIALTRYPTPLQQTLIGILVYGALATLVRAGTSVVLAGGLSTWIPQERLNYALVSDLLPLLLPLLAGFVLTRLAWPARNVWAVAVLGPVVWLLIGTLVDVPVEVRPGTGGGLGTGFDLLPSPSDFSAIPPLDFLVRLALSCVAVVVGSGLCRISRVRRFAA